jgi:hypothetical protein
MVVGVKELTVNGVPPRTIVGFCLELKPLPVMVMVFALVLTVAVSIIGS